MYYNYFILQVYTDKWQCGLSQQGYIAAARVYESSIVYILTQRAAVLWTFTIWLIWSFKWGLQMGAAYSSLGEPKFCLQLP